LLKKLAGNSGSGFLNDDGWQFAALKSNNTAAMRRFIVPGYKIMSAFAAINNI
jgi:hypothetical protein